MNKTNSSGVKINPKAGFFKLLKGGVFLTLVRKMAREDVHFTQITLNLVQQISGL